MFGQSALDSGEDRLPWDEGTWARTTLVGEGVKGRRGVAVIGRLFPSAIRSQKQVSALAEIEVLDSPE